MPGFVLESMMIDNILSRWPETANAFNRHRMACPGCAMAPFMTLTEACAAYGLDLKKVAHAVRQSIGQDVSSQREGSR